MYFVFSAKDKMSNSSLTTAAVVLFVQIETLPQSLDGSSQCETWLLCLCFFFINLKSTVLTTVLDIIYCLWFIHSLYSSDFVAAFWITPSGEGVGIVCSVTNCTNPICSIIPLLPSHVTYICIPPDRELLNCNAAHRLFYKWLFCDPNPWPCQLPVPTSSS